MSTVALSRVTLDTIARARRTADRDTVARILDRVKREGDIAVQSYALAFGDPAPRRIGPEECAHALDRVSDDLHLALERMRSRVAHFAQAQRRALREFSYTHDGLTMGQRIVPIRSVGAYVPSGRYPLPTTAMMTIVPAQVAGVERIAVCTPRATDAILAVCAILGVDEVYEIGGAQAIGALAYGTPSVAPVEKIVGPGNAYVNEAKRQVSGVCGIDLPAGPSEVAVIASYDADPASVARSLLAEAEHDPDARAYLLVDDEALLEAVQAEVERQAAGLPTAPIARQALAASGAILCESLDECARAADSLAVEHLELHGAEALTLRDRIASYGALFLDLPAALGDYGTGPNHTLPTGAAARFASGLSVYDFVLVRPFIERAGAEPIDLALLDDCALIARAEGLPAHEAALRALLPHPE